MADIENLKPGQTFYSIDRVKGVPRKKNRALFCFVILEIGKDKKWVLASRNGKPARRYWATSVARWKSEKPEERV